MNIAKPRGLRAVIDGDGHLMEDANLWIDYIAPGYRDVAPRLVADGDGARLMMDGRLFPIKSGPGVGRPQGLRYHSWQRSATQSGQSVISRITDVRNSALFSFPVVVMCITSVKNSAFDCVISCISTTRT